jgi:hypothetical protein
MHWRARKPLVAPLTIEYWFWRHRSVRSLEASANRRTNGQPYHLIRGGFDSARVPRRLSNQCELTLLSSNVGVCTIRLPMGQTPKRRIANVLLMWAGAKREAGLRGSGGPRFKCPNVRLFDSARGREAGATARIGSGLRSRFRCRIGKSHDLARRRVCHERFPGLRIARRPPDFFGIEHSHHL